MILAAGIGSRDGGRKQLDPADPAGETILDYAVFDAARARGRRALFVIQRDLEPEFRARIDRRYERRLQVDSVFQSRDALPSGVTTFLLKHESEPQAGFYLLAAISANIEAGEADVQVLTTPANWFGITYRQDKPRVSAASRELVRQGDYPIGREWAATNGEFRA